jgi:peptidoglycan/xylan/chitin deacetylase (PgdA/CDA1 family)
MYLSKTPEIIKPLASSFIWDIPHVVNEVFITFDDGPIPEVTPYVLDILAEYNAKATFFCVGANAEKHPELLERLLYEGHAIGNHTWAHENGWKTSQFSYLRSVMQADELLNCSLFRPPYGRITKQQADALKKRFSLIMWDVLSGDFDTNISPAQCLKNVTENTRPGSIIVFHDSIKAKDNVLSVLPDFLRVLNDMGWHSSILDERKKQ